MRRTSSPRRVSLPTPAWFDPGSQLAAIVEHSNDAIFSRTFDGVITTWNTAATRIFGYTATEIIGQSGRVLLPPGCEDEYRKLVARLRRGQVVAHFETVRVRKGGQFIRVSLTLSPIRDSSRRLLGFSTIARDITEQMRMRNALARRELELDDLFEQASVGLMLVSPDGVVLRANQAFLAMLQRRSMNVTDRPLKTFHPDAETLNDLLRRLARRETIHNVATEFLIANGELRFVLVDADGLWEQGRLVHTRWFIRDISRRRQLERELLENTDLERRGFAQELHDGLGQQLGGVAYLSNVLRERLAERDAPEADSAARIFDLVRQAIEDTRRMARGLSPIREDPEGLMEALQELTAQASECKEIRCRFQCRQPVLVSDPTLAGHLYRIAQEAVNNAVKHANPRVIAVSLRKVRNKLTLTIADDGRGIGPLSPHRGGLGLRIMQYRAGLIRGNLEVRSRRVRGTEVVCTTPLPMAKTKTSRS